MFVLIFGRSVSSIDLRNDSYNKNHNIRKYKSLNKILLLPLYRELSSCFETNCLLMDGLSLLQIGFQE